MSDGAGCEVPRGVRGAGKPASQFWQRPGRGRARGFPRSRQRKGNGDARCAPARLRWGGASATSVKGMEMHVGPRPVKGGPGRTGVKTRPLTKPHGGSRGPVDPWSASTASKRWGEALERLCREIAQQCADGRSVKRARSSVSGRRTGGQCKRAGALPYLRTVTREQRCIEKMPKRWPPSQ